MNKNRKRSAQSSASLTKGKNTIKRYFYNKAWDTSFKTATLNQEEIIRRLENNLPIDDLYDTLDSKYKRTGKYKTKPNGNEDL